MKKYLWYTKDASSELDLYAILECSNETAEEIENLKNEKLWKFIADRLYEKYPNEFPEWFDEYGKRRLFWYSNTLEDYEELYERLVKEEMEIIRENINYDFDYGFVDDDEEDIKESAEREINEELESLPLYVI